MPENGLELLVTEKIKAVKVSAEFIDCIENVNIDLCCKCYFKESVLDNGSIIKSFNSNGETSLIEYYKFGEIISVVVYCCKVPKTEISDKWQVLVSASLIE